MSRFLTLEEYLEQFVDDSPQSVGDDVLIITDCQAQSLGYFFLNGLTGFLECARLERIANSESAEAIAQADQDEFIN